MLGLHAETRCVQWTSLLLQPLRRLLWFAGLLGKFCILVLQQSPLEQDSFQRHVLKESMLPVKFALIMSAPSSAPIRAACATTSGHVHFGFLVHADTSWQAEAYRRLRIRQLLCPCYTAFCPRLVRPRSHVRKQRRA